MVRARGWRTIGGTVGYGVSCVLAVMVLDITQVLPRNDLVAVSIAVVCGIAEYWAVRLGRSHRVPRMPGVVPTAGSLAPPPSRPGEAAG